METNIYALTDSHQESRNLSRLLSGIYNLEKTSDKPFLILDAGDLFKGIYDKNLSVNAYLKIKSLLPQAQIFITLGNNDFGFRKSDFEFLKSAIKKFETAGINVISSNLTPKLVPDYKIIDINNQKILITGFCLNNSCAKKFGCELSEPIEAFEKIIHNIPKENYDKIITLNHHWYPCSKKLKEKFPQIDLIIGGHEHSPITPDYENNIFYPYSFARSMYTMTINKTLHNIKEIPINDCPFLSEFLQPIEEYEKYEKLNDPIAKRVLNLTKRYSEPCPLGTFISDEMKNISNTDIAFHSTGFTMYPLGLCDSPYITKYDFERTICAPTPIETIELTSSQLKEVFQNAAKYRMLKDRGNSRFLQCSGNIKITGKGNTTDKTYKITQISINNENLLDINANPIDSSKKYSCTIDSYIGSGEQGFYVLKNIPKTRVIKNGSEIHLNQLLLDALKRADKNFDGNSQYPSFEFIDL